MKTNNLHLKSIIAFSRKKRFINRAEVKTAQILFISTFPPRECGIATYTADLITAIRKHFEQNFTAEICALENDKAEFDYEDEPLYVLNTDKPESYSLNLKEINANKSVKLIVIQHEFGLFKNTESQLIEFIANLATPVILVFHTVLPNPDAMLFKKVRDLADTAQYIIVMTCSAVKILSDEYGIKKEKIQVIPHGTHLPLEIDNELLKQKLHLTNREILTTFGLISESKCIETTIEALPRVVEKFPNVLFLLLGKTHPEVYRQGGEKYRDSLKKRISELQVARNVRMIDSYLPLDLLQTYLQLTDIYLFTSKDASQAVSGTFSYALAAGCPVISTPMPHAVELLDEENGVIVPFNDSKMLASEIIKLLGDHDLRQRISLNVIHKITKTNWRNSAIAHVDLFQKLTKNALQFRYKIPPIELKHIFKLTDKFGMIQFSNLSTPDLSTGYTLDDNARALIALSEVHIHGLQKKLIDLLEIYLNFIAYCQQPDGSFLNYVDVTGKFTDQNYRENLEDSNGRALWALGTVISKKQFIPERLINLALTLFDNGINNVKHIHSTRAMAFIIKALVADGRQENSELVKLFSHRLVQMYLHEKTSNWNWFESYLTYANSLLPEALLQAALFTDNATFKEIACESFEFILSRVFFDGKLKVISNKGWQFKGHAEKAVTGGEQPIDVAYTILALEKFHSAFRDKRFKVLSINAFYWFLGANHLKQAVYQEETGGCCDGIEETNVNLNQGAESTLSYLLARLAISRILH